MDVVARETPVRHRPLAEATAAPATPPCSPRSASSRACGPAPSTCGATPTLRRPQGRRRGRRQGRPPPGRAPARRRRRASWSPTSSGGACAAVPAAHPQVAGRSPTPTRWSAADLDVYSPCALGGALTDDVRGRADARRSSAAAPTTSSPTRASRSCSPTAGVLYAPDYVRQRRRGDPGGRRAARLRLRAGQGQGRRGSSTPPLGVLRTRRRTTASRRPRPPTGSPSSGWPRPRGLGRSPSVTPDSRGSLRSTQVARGTGGGRSGRPAGTTGRDAGTPRTAGTVGVTRDD